MTGVQTCALPISAYERAQQLLVKHRDKLEIIAQTLLEKEKINETEFNKIFEEEL